MVDTHRSSSGLVDRVDEREVLERLLAGVRTGQSRVLVLRGEAGVGKTALLRHLSGAAKGCRIARAAGVESEMELPFAGLHALCAPMLDRLEHLPIPQRDALSTAFGLTAGPPPDRFLVGLAVLSLLADAAEEQPLVCIVDDAHWLDRVSAQTLSFVARRLLAERVGLVFGLRESGGQHVLEGLPELVIEGLAADEARLLLDAAIPGPLDERVKARILGEAGGNPLALIELPRGLTPAEVAGGFGLPDGRPLTSRIEHTFLQRAQALPRETQLLLLTAAAEPLGDLSLLWRAADRLGIGGEAGQPAEAARLIELDARVRFPHPLVRSAVYRASHPSDRRDVHRALADSTDRDVDPDRCAWHRAHATAVPDEEVAAEMARSAERAQGRGGLAAAAAFLQRAAELTPDPARRVERSLAAAQAKLDVADTAAASDLLEGAALGPVDELQRARLERLGAQIVFRSRRGRDAPPLLLEAARRLDPLDAKMARETYLEAIAAAMYAGRLGTGPDEHEVAESARTSTGAPGPGRGRPAPRRPRHALHRGIRERPSRRSRGRCGRSANPAAAERIAAGSGWRAGSRRISGTTSSGTRSRPAACASRVTPARSTCSRTRSTTSPRSTSIPAPSPPLRRRSKRSVRSPRRPGSRHSGTRRARWPRRAAIRRGCRRWPTRPCRARSRRATGRRSPCPPGSSR